MPSLLHAEPADQLKNAHVLTNAVRDGLRKSLLTLEDNLWLKACRAGVGNRDEEWLKRVASESEGESDWVIKVFENAPIRTPPPLTNQARTAKAIANCALASLYLRRLSVDPSDVQTASALPESLYRAAAQWQPQRTLTVYPADRSGHIFDVMRRAMISPDSPEGKHWAALRAVGQAHAGWEVAPVGDLIDYFLSAERRRWGRAVELNVMLDCGVGGGLVAALRLRKREGGFGKLYRDPLTMSFLQHDEDFQVALSNAWEYARASGFAVDGCDVTWQLISKDAVGAVEASIRFDRIPDYVMGASAGAGLALGLQYLFVDEDLSPLALKDWAVTGAVTAGGAIGHVDVSPNKLKAVASDRKLKAIVPSADWDEISKQWKGRLEVEGAGSIKEADYIVRRRARDERKRVRDRFIVYSAIAATILILVAATAVSGVQWTKAVAQKRVAEDKKAEAETERGIAQERGNELDLANKELDQTNRELTAKEDELNKAYELLRKNNIVLKDTNADLANKKAYAERQRQVAEAARRQEEKQRKRAEELEREADRQKEIAQAQRQVTAASQLGMVANKFLSDGNSTVAQMLYAKALTLDDRSDFRSGYIAAKTKGKFVKLWQSFNDKGDQFGALAISPDGQLIADGGYEEVRLLNTNDGKLVKTLTGHSDAVYSAAFSPDGRHLATGGVDGTVRIWDITNGAEVHRLTFNNKKSTNNASSPEDSEIKSSDDIEFATSLAYSPDGKLLVAGTANQDVDGATWVWDAESFSVLHTRKQAYPVISVAFDKDGRFASGNASGEVLFWRKRGDYSQVTEFAHRSPVSSIAFGSNGELISAGGASINIWNTTTNKWERGISGNFQSVECISVSTNGETLATGGSDQTVRLWDVQTGKELLSFGSFQGEVIRIQFGLNGNLAVKSKDMNHVTYWRVDEGSQDVQSFMGITGIAYHVAFSPDGKWLAATSSETGNVLIWDKQTGAIAHEVSNESRNINEIAFSPDGRWIFLGGIDTTVHLLEVETVKQSTLKGNAADIALPADRTGVAPFSTSDTIDVGAFSPDGKTLATNGLKGTVLLWDLKTGQVIRQLQSVSSEVNAPLDGSGLRNVIAWLVFSPNGRYLASGGTSGVVTVWNIYNDETPRTFDAGDLLTTGAFSPDSQYLASGGRSLRLWNLESNRGVLEISGNNERVASIAFSPGGKLLAWATGYARKVRFWDMGMGTERLALQDCESASMSIAFSSNENSFATSCEDGAVYVRNWQTLEHIYDARPEVLLGETQSDINLDLKGEGKIFTAEAFTPTRLSELLGKDRDASLTLTSAQDKADTPALDFGLFSLSGSPLHFSCSDPPLKAELNTFALTFSSPAFLCSNYPPLDLRLVKDGWYSKSEAEWKQGRTGKEGDEIYASVYISNVAANNPVLPESIARNVQLTTSVDTIVGAEHRVSVKFGGTNTNAVSVSLPIKTGPNDYLEIVPHSGQIRNYTTTKIIKDEIQIGNNTILVGDIAPGFETDLFLRFTLRVKTRR
jgi:WD40 repeat protein